MKNRRRKRNPAQTKTKRTKAPKLKKQGPEMKENNRILSRTSLSRRKKFKMKMPLNKSPWRLTKSKKSLRRTRLKMSHKQTTKLTRSKTCKKRPNLRTLQKKRLKPSLNRKSRKKKAKEKNRQKKNQFMKSLRKLKKKRL